MLSVVIFVLFVGLESGNTMGLSMWSYSILMCFCVNIGLKLDNLNNVCGFMC